MQVTRDDIALNTYDFREMRGNKASGASASR